MMAGEQKNVKSTWFTLGVRTLASIWTIITYQTVILLLVGWLWYRYVGVGSSMWFPMHQLPLQSMLTGAVGGVSYCMRAVYINRCVKNKWDSRWWPWYIVRPLLGSLVGVVAFLLLSAGLFVFGGAHESPTHSYGTLILSWVAGYNVDGFLSRVERMAQFSWRISPSQLAKDTGSEALTTNKER